MTSPPRPTRRPDRTGPPPTVACAFTLLEVMFAILMLGVGLVAVAGIFPIAGGIQRDTYDQAIAQSVATSAEQYLAGRGIPASVLGSVGSGVTDLGVTTLSSIIPLSDRCAPYFNDANGNGTPNDSTAEDNTFVARDFYWYPLFRNDLNLGYQAFIFVMKWPGFKDTSGNSLMMTTGSPLVPTTSGGIAAGEMYVDSSTGKISSATADSSTASGWHAPILASDGSTVSVTNAGAGTSTFKQLSVVGIEATP